MRLTDEDLRKRRVIAADGTEVGQCAGLVFDTETMAVVAVRVRVHAAVSRAQGSRKPLIGRAELTVPVEQVSGIADAVILRPTTSQLLAK